METKNNSITEGPIGRQLLFFFFPILFGSFFQQLYNTADAMVVGRYVSKEALAAVGGTTGTLINLFVGFFVGISSGFSVIISQRFGAQRDEEVSQCVHTAITFSIITGLLLSVIGYILSPLALSLMNVPEDIFPLAKIYLQIYFMGMTANLVYNMGAAILRAIGDSRRPLYFLIASTFTNILLDILLVGILKIGVAGAAIATIVSQLVSAVLVIFVLLTTKTSYQLHILKLRIYIEPLKQMVYIGLAAGLQSMMYTISNIIIQAYVNALGTDTIAAWTVYGKIDTIFWMSIQAMGISTTTFVGQNFGAGKADRVKKGIRWSLFISFVMTISISVLLFLFGSHIFSLFTKDQEVIHQGNYILHHIASLFVTYVFVEIYSGSLRSVGDCWIPMAITGIGVCMLRILWLVIFFPTHQSITTVIASYPISWTTSSLFFIFYMHKFSGLQKWLKINA